MRSKTSVFNWSMASESWTSGGALAQYITYGSVSRVWTAFSFRLGILSASAIFFWAFLV